MHPGESSVPKVIIAAALAVAVALFAPTGSHAQSTTVQSEASRKAELTAAWQAAAKVGTGGPAEIPLVDQAVLKIPAGNFFVPKTEGARVLRALGNITNEATLVGLIVGTAKDSEWLVVTRYIRDGYIKDDDAKNWNADDLLTSLREGTEEANKDRVSRGFPELEVMGWQEKPAYNADTHRLVWSLLAKHKGEPDTVSKNINYNTYALGRDGYFSLNLLSSSDRIASDKGVALNLLDNLAYNAGKRYEDFNASTDQIAAYGLAALVGGAVVKKLGLFALIAATALKFTKVILVGVAAIGAAILKFVRRKPRDSSS